MGQVTGRKYRGEVGTGQCRWSALLLLLVLGVHSFHCLTEQVAFPAACQLAMLGFSSVHLPPNPDPESATLLKGSSCHIAQGREGEVVCVLPVGSQESVQEALTSPLATGQLGD